MKKIFIILITIFWATVAASPPLSLKLRNQKIGAHKNSLYVRDVMRLAKAADMRNYMNESVDPCHDFYEFVCGNWPKVNPTIEITETGYIYQLIQGIKRKKLELLKLSTEADDLETPNERKVKDFYRSCMKAENVAQSSYKEPLLKLINEFGTMPALEPSKWNATNFDWIGTIAKIKSVYNIEIILGSAVSSDMKNNTFNRLYLGKPTFKLEVRSMYLDEKNKKYRENYRDAMKKELMQIFEMHKENAEKLADDILNFEIELAKGFPDEKADSSLRDNFLATTVAEMQEKYAPIIDVEKYVYINFGEIIEGTVYEVEQGYQENLQQVINATSKETLANYIFYRLLTTLVPDKVDAGKERMNYCEKITEIFFSELLENMIYRRFDTRKTERDINLIFGELKKAFRAKLSSNDLNWMSLKTRQNALEKLEALNIEITSYTERNFTEEFAKVEIDDSNLLENIKSLHRNLAENERAELFNPKPKKPTSPSYTPVFSHRDNTVKVPVALLQPNYFWSSNYPHALKFGSIGSLLGHELVHGFADHGMKYDKLGNQNNWWDVESAAAFQDRTECFKNQYAHYIFGDIRLPRAEDQSENIADNGGLRLAYEAYMGWRTESERFGDDFTMETLPLLKYNDKKLFYISFGQVWCNEVNSLYRAMKVATDEHTPAKYRVIGTLSNFEEFSKEFNCRPNVRMNPSKRCVIY